MVVQTKLTMKNLRKISYQEVLAQKNYDFLVSHGASFYEAREIKSLILDGFSPEEAMWKFIVEWCEEEWADALEENYFEGSLGLCQFISEFVTDVGLKDLENHMSKLGCKGWGFTALTYNQGAYICQNLFGCSVKTAIKRIREHGFSETKIHAIGDGEWSLEVYDEEGDCMFEFVGSNGTRREADDLYAQLDTLLDLV